ncbi:hypothetical protein E1A91_D12G070600v1 [Gossypium mustelinum]|uniref:F-box associated beta-propeller type 1 domain-containing protein n=1 Tax=Gossypium mustelinum TaxID=34275 RepID=A0A5D2SAB9_GOSMU|nr:hypothetical protein E1A91_D12G070600v1 [Gossypium mustelinum]
MDLKGIIRENALPYLPAKSLFRCAGVCRGWRFQISTAFFAHNQSNSFRGISGFFFQSLAGMPAFMSLDPRAYGVPDPSLTFLPEPVDVRTSCNGLLCCQGRTPYRPYYICNPANKQWKELSKPDGDHGPDPAVVLVFEPSIMNFTANYKLVCPFPSELGEYKFEVYSSDRGSWRTSGEIRFDDNEKLLPKTGVHVNGIVYWLSTRGVTSFDLNSELCRLSSNLENLGMINGKLCAACLRNQKLIVFMLTNPQSHTRRRAAVKTWTRILPEIKLDSTLPVESTTCPCNYSGRYCDGHNQLHIVFVGDVVVLRKRNSYYCIDMNKKASNCLGEYIIHPYERFVGYVNGLVNLY